MSPEGATKNEGSQVVFLCEVDFDKEYTVEWTFHGLPLPSNSRVMYDMEVVIDSITMDNAGEYMCLVKFEDYMSSAVGLLQVSGVSS